MSDLSLSDKDMRIVNKIIINYGEFDTWWHRLKQLFRWIFVGKAEFASWGEEKWVR